MYGEIASAAAGTASGLYGAATSADEARKQRHLAARQFNAQMDYAKNQTQIRVQDALKAGINPLVALGVNSTVSPTIHAGGTSGAGEIMANTGADVGNHLGNALNQALEDKAFDDLDYDRQVKSLDLESRRIQNRILQGQELQQQQNLAKGAAKEVVSTKDVVDDEHRKPMMMGEELLFKPVYDLHGRPRLVINQNALEADSDNPGYMSSIMNAIGNAMINDQITPDGRVVSPQLQMLIDDFYYQTTGHHIVNLQDLYISPTEAALAAEMLVRGQH